MSKGTRLHVDLCCGLGGWQEPFRNAENWRTVGLDIRRDLSPDVVADVRQLPLADCNPELLTMSPPCTQFSRWMMPWLDEPNPDMDLVQACLDATNHLEPEYWVLENSRGLDQYWKPARRNVGPYYLWGEWPPFDVDERCAKGKMQTSGENPEERARIPHAVANALRKAVEMYA